MLNDKKFSAVWCHLEPEKAAAEIERLRCEREEIATGLAVLLKDMDELMDGFGLSSEHPVRKQLHESRDKLLMSR